MVQEGDQKNNQKTKEDPFMFIMPDDENNDGRT
jgi:hypothetical protein